MGFFQRLFGGERQIELSATRFTRQRVDAELEIVGEASYQDGIASVAGALGWDGPEVRTQTAVLLLEPDNRYDPNAVAVYLLGPPAVGMRRAGYLARELAPLYRPVFGLLSGNAILALAHLKGGWRRGPDRGSLGVVLNLGSPGELAAEILLEHVQPGRGHRWDGRLVAFTGDSRFRIGGVRLDKPGQQYLAEAAGCKTWPRVTKKVQVCVTSSPEVETGNLTKAERYDLELVPEWEFWPSVGLILESL